VITYVLVALVALVLTQSVYLWRVQRALRALPQFDDRLSRLAHSVSLLVDTTEGCFEAISSQLVRGDEPKAKRPDHRQGRQRRVVGAARRGRTISQIAQEESAPEGEIALRLHMARDLPLAPGG